MNEDDEVYVLTFKGLLSTATDDYQDVLDAVELYMRRHGYNAIVFDEGQFQFVNVEKG